MGNCFHEQCTVVVQCKEDFVGHVIGRKGAKINRIRDKLELTGCIEVKWDKENGIMVLEYVEPLTKEHKDSLHQWLEITIQKQDNLHRKKSQVRKIHADS